MVRAAALACLAMLAGCDSGSNAQQRLQGDQALYARMERLEARIVRLEDGAAKPSPIPAPVAAPRQSSAVMLGSTTRGAPVREEFSSLAACQSARASLVAEADRICTQRKGEPGVVFVDCLYPQISCSRK